jgi:type IV pilus assembly protein PilB
MSVKSFGERIADVLMEDGLLLPAQLEEAMELQKKQGGRLLKILTDKHYVTEQDMVISMGRCLDTPPVNLSKVRVPEEIQRLVPKDMARTYKLAPVAKLGNKLFVAMADPLNVLALDDLRQRTKLEIVPMITTERSVAEALSGVGTGGASMEQVLAKAASQADVEEVKENREEIDLDKLAVESEDAPVVKIVNLILVQALKEKASDIHIEPFNRILKLRYRVDGNLIEATSPPKALQLPIRFRARSTRSAWTNTRSAFSARRWMLRTGCSSSPARRALARLPRSIPCSRS